MKTSLTLLAIAASVAGAAAIAATTTAANDAIGAAQASITLTQAIAAAEQSHPGGKASKAEYERSKAHGWVYDVEVVSGHQVFDVTVNPREGTVIASTVDAGDHDNDHDAVD